MTKDSFLYSNYEVNSVVNMTTNTKSWIKSKTLWLNVWAIIVLAIQGQYGFVMGPEYQVAFLALINMVLRGITSGSIE